MYFHFAFVFLFNLIVNQGITGTIPSEIGLLTELTTVELRMYLPKKSCCSSLFNSFDFSSLSYNITN